MPVMKNFLLLIFFIPLVLFSQQDQSDNIVISSSVENYVYSYSKSQKTVEVKQEIDNQYTCTSYRDKASFFEFFDDQSTLDDVTLYENGKKSYAEKELHDYYVSDVFYSDAKYYQLSLDFPKSGWQNEVRLKKTIKDPRYFCTIFFSEAYPVLQKEVTIVIPRWMKAEIKEFNFDGYSITKEQSYSEKQDADIIKYSIKTLPARKSEEHQPGPSYFLPHLLLLNKSASANDQQFAYFNTLKDQYDWYHKIVSATNNDGTIVKAKAAEVTAHAKTDLDKIKNILYWVHDNIRYVAFEDGIAGFKPDEAQNVLNKKYGDCKGMANLTKELLRSLGFDARLAWIGTSRIRYDYTTPALCVDNHMICCLFYNGKKYFLDGTETFLPFENYAERIQGRQVLIEDGANYILEKIPVTSPDQNFTLFKENMKIINNAIQGDVEYVFKGESKEHLLTSIHSSKKESLNSQMEKYISNDNKSYRISEVKTSDLDETDGDLSIAFKVTYDGAVSSFGNEMYVDLDYNKTFDHFLIDTSKRKYDYCFSYKYDYNTEVKLEIPEGYKLSSLPADLEIKTPDFYFSISYKTMNNSIYYKKQIRIANVFLKKNNFSGWNKAIAQLSSKYTEQITLTKK
jgi:hypothetical protein